MYDQENINYKNKVSQHMLEIITKGGSRTVSHAHTTSNTTPPPFLVFGLVWFLVFFRDGGGIFLLHNINVQDI